MITPMQENQTIHEAALRELVRHLIAAGAHGLFCLGTNGEFYSLTEAEKVHVARIVVEEAGGCVPVYAGSGGISTREVAGLSARLEQVGVDALSIISPYFNKFSQKELQYHYETVAAAVSLPILLYNIPARTGNTLEPQTVAALSQVPNIVGIKDSSGNFETILKYIEETDDDFAVMAGTDTLILPTLLAGGTGAIAATANVFPKLVVAIYDYWLTGGLEQAQQAQQRIGKLRDLFKLGTLPSVLKGAMNAIGFPAGPPRLPVLPMEEHLQPQLQQVLELYEQSGELLVSR